MGSRERHREQRHGNPANDGTSSDELDEVRATGEAFLDAGDEAIRRALSSDSTAFLRANRQRGGQ